MKKFFLFSLLFTAISFVTDAQIILVSPNVTNNMAEKKEPLKKDVAFRLSPFSYPVSLPANVSSETGTDITVTIKEFDLGNNTSGSSFIVPENGVYHFDVRMNITFPISEYQDYNRFYLMLNKNGSVMEKTILMNPQTAISPFHTLMISTTHMLMKGDVITTSYNADANPGDRYVSASEVSFSGFRINFMAGDAAATGIIK